MFKTRTVTLPAGRYFIGNPAPLLKQEDSFPALYEAQKDMMDVLPFSMMDEGFVANAGLYDYDEAPWEVSAEQHWMVLLSYMTDYVDGYVRFQIGDAAPTALEFPCTYALGILPAAMVGDEAHYLEQDAAAQKEGERCTGVFVTFEEPLQLVLVVSMKGKRETDIYKYAYVNAAKPGNVMLQLWFTGEHHMPPPVSPLQMVAAAASGDASLATVPDQVLWNMWAGVQVYDDVFKVNMGKSYRLLCRSLWDTHGDTKRILAALSHEIARRACIE